jgi:hypothetical protein
MQKLYNLKGRKKEVIANILKLLLTEPGFGPGAFDLKDNLGKFMWKISFRVRFNFVLFELFTIQKLYISLVKTLRP